MAAFWVADQLYSCHTFLSERYRILQNGPTPFPLKFKPLSEEERPHLQPRASFLLEGHTCEQAEIPDG